MAKRFKRKNPVERGTSAPVSGAGFVAPSMPREFPCEWLFGLVLFLGVILIYLPVVQAGFFWDDEMLITANPVIVGPLGLKEIWTTSAADICPLTLSTFWVEHALWGLNPLPYHLVNVLLHGLCAILLWRALLGLRVPGAWLGAALWAFHPVEVESVAWITEMKNTESGVFFLLAILFFIRWLKAENREEQTGRQKDYACTLIFAALAMAGKSSTVILPGVLCLCAWWMERRWQWRNLVRVAPLVLMAIAASALSLWTQKLTLETHADPQWVRTFPERLVAAGKAVWFYLGKLLWPHPVTLFYPRWQIDTGHGISYLPLLAVAVVMFILWHKRAGPARPFFFAFAYFLGAILPALGLLDNFIFRYSLVFDHFQYLAGMVPLALAGAGIVRGAELVMPGKAWIPVSLGAGVLLVLGMLSWQRTCAYESDERIWADTLKWNPNSWLSHNNLGNVYLKKGEVDKAMDEFQKTLAINPDYADAHYNLALTFFQKGRMDEGIAECRKAVDLNPDMADARLDLGNALLQKGNIDEAIAHYQRALVTLPDYADAHNNLGYALLKKGRVDEAILQFQAVVRLNPQDSQAQDALAKARAMTHSR